MNLQELRDVQDRERATDSLQDLPEGFYADVAEYIAELKAEREAAAERADDPFGSPEVGRLTDEIQTAEGVAEAIYERRIGKILNQASLAAADVGGEVGGLTAEERALFEDLVDRITENKHRVLDVLAGETDAETTDEQLAASSDSPDSPADSATDNTRADPTPDSLADDEPTGDEQVDAADLMGASSEADDDADRDVPPDTATDGAGTAADDHTTVRVTRDVGEVFGVDERVYSLATDDVVSLPDENAEALVDRDAAEPLE